MNTAKLVSLIKQNGSLNGLSPKNQQLKFSFHRTARLVCLEIVERMGYAPDEYEIRVNKAGIAVSGEVTLHAKDLYVKFDGFTLDGQFMYRSCKGLSDYSGGANRWMKYEELLDFDSVIKKMHLARKENIK